VDQLSLGVVATSRKPDERRLAIHPAHFDRIDGALARCTFVERGYGERFGVTDARLEPLVGGLRSRAQLFAECDVLLLPKPVAADPETLRRGQVVWGWPHCVQDRRMTQLAIERELTLIAWEAMNHWTEQGSFSGHVFHKNNELAGYCSVMHALQLLGSTGAYGRPLRAAVIGFGAAGRGAVTGLSALGITDVTVLARRSVAAVASPDVPPITRTRSSERDRVPVASWGVVR
jgi:alanine dehydrogenase